MENIQYTFKRYEKKYLLTPEQFVDIRKALSPHLTDDHYGLHTINNIYFDTPDFSMIRYSLTHPKYKEKFRLRSYGTTDEQTPVFAEIKKKYKHVVYKRRISLAHELLYEFFSGHDLEQADFLTQQEIRWLLYRWQPFPQVYIGYDRIACYGKEDPQLRVTFDQNLRWRRDDLELSLGDYGDAVLDDEKIIMEIKFPQTSPLWLSSILSDLNIYPVSFSKYGTCYTKHLHLPRIV